MFLFIYRAQTKELKYKRLILKGVIKNLKTPYPFQFLEITNGLNVFHNPM